MSTRGPLPALGHRVRLLDLVPANVAQARAGQPAVEADVADARALSEESDGALDRARVYGREPSLVAASAHLLARGGARSILQNRTKLSRGRAMTCANHRTGSASALRYRDAGRRTADATR